MHISITFFTIIILNPIITTMPTPSSVLIIIIIFFFIIITYFVMLRMVPRALHVPSKYSTLEIHPQSTSLLLCDAGHGT